MRASVPNERQRARHLDGSATLRDHIAISGRIVRQGRLGLAGGN
jgi:hypothetical protein